MVHPYNKNQRDALISQIYFGLELYMFRTGLLSMEHPDLASRQSA